MEMGSVLEFLENKCIMVTGATGFLAKIFVEKILRVSNVKKLYLLLRASDEKSATLRFYNEILGKDLFKVVKEKYGQNLNSVISEKIKLVAGDISREDLGLKDSKLVHEMIHELDAIVNLAATTNFDERYDVALGINTLGAKHVMNFAKRCTKLKVLVHVSTAYVCGVKSGVISETPYPMGETPNGTTGLDINVEKMVAEEKLDQLRAAGSSPENITESMKDLGLARAKMYGWPNTYVFTKAMGEMMIGANRENVSLVILRPTIVTSTFAEPFPGWTEGVRTIDSLFVGYGKGKLTCFLGDLEAISDIIPADMVVSSILVSMIAQADRKNEVIYQLGSSTRNPMKNSKVPEVGYRYFSMKPWINKDGKTIRVSKVKVLGSMSSFHRYMAIHYHIPLKGLDMVNLALCRLLQTECRDLKRKINYSMRLVDLYQPYLFFPGVFDDTNTEKLRTAARRGGVEMDVFYFDPKNIDWDDYFLNIHIPGLVKYVL